jgi:hypothetical protein
VEATVVVAVAEGAVAREDSVVIAKAVTVEDSAMEESSVKAVDIVEDTAEIAKEVNNVKAVDIVEDTAEIAKEVNNVKEVDIVEDTAAIAKEAIVVLIVAEEVHVVATAARPCQPLLKWTTRRISRPSAKSLKVKFNDGSNLKKLFMANFVVLLIFSRVDRCALKTTSS